jgi:hypothetical protein
MPVMSLFVAQARIKHGQTALFRQVFIGNTLKNGRTNT